jgi:hypothetical protein
LSCRVKSYSQKIRKITMNKKRKKIPINKIFYSLWAMNYTS